MFKLSSRRQTGLIMPGFKIRINFDQTSRLGAYLARKWCRILLGFGGLFSKKANWRFVALTSLEL